MEQTLKKLRVVLTVTTMTATSTLHGEFTDLPEAVTSLRKLADAIETELRREHTETHHPSRNRVRCCLDRHRDEMADAVIAAGIQIGIVRLRRYPQWHTPSISLLASMKAYEVRRTTTI